MEEKLKKRGTKMKIFNMENGIKKVYVQKNDIQELAMSNIHVPQSLLKK